ncbi:hypothetical protein [Deinococcus hohokamensis]|uniref:Uncharacterized protein n=1 Tax=Deinococcus hohokamensis TaxID=309883 RepID=A0ABV9I4C4_9DEIO
MYGTRFGPLSPTPPLKERLSTVVDAFTEKATPLALTSRLGKRRLFKHRAWPEPAGDGWLRVKFFPGWIDRLPSGRPCLVQSRLCREGQLDTLIQEVQAEHGVHLWVAPISLPTQWPRGNWWWPVNEHVQALMAGWATTAVAA